MRKVVSVFCLFVLFVLNVKGQADSSDAHSSLRDSVTASVKPVYNPYRWTIAGTVIPVGLITYGVIALHSGALKDVNEHFHEQIWTNHPHDMVHVDNYLQWAPAVAVYGLNLAGVKGYHNLRDRSIIYGMSLVLMSSATAITKNVSHEWRPDMSDDKSFPSGHTANAFAAAEFMRREYSNVSPWYGIAGYAAAITTGYFRMYNNKHWFSDVVGGAGVGILSTNIAYWVYPSIKKWLFKKDKAGNAMALPFYQNGVTGLALMYHL
jgi:membrane-associated phospholipid phosphatase